jgi:hypothetical protein
VDGVWTCCGLKAEAEWWLLVGGGCLAGAAVQCRRASGWAWPGALDNVLAGWSLVQACDCVCSGCDCVIVV